MTRYPQSLAALLATAMAATALAAAPLAPALAQSSTAKPPAAAAATSNKPETVEQRITTLKTALKITPEQETKWKAVADAMRQNAGAMQKLVDSKHAQAASMTAVDDLKTYQEFSQAHLDGLKNLTSAFESLYGSMTPDQKKNADKVFMSYGPGNSKSQG